MADSVGTSVTGPSVDRNPTSDQQPETILEEQYHPTPQPLATATDEVMPKQRKTRQRRFRGLSSMASSSSLSATGRARSASTPYDRSGASLSCISLPNGAGSFAQSPSSADSSALASPYLAPMDDYFSQTPPATTIPFPPFPHSQSCNALRKIGLAAGSTTALASTTALPQDMVRTASLPIFSPRPRKTFYQLWNRLPRELKLQTLGYLRPKEVVRVSRVNKQFHKLCFDGQLWTHFDASEFYQDIPVESLSKIITAAGPFVKNLNLRGCIQIEKYQDALLMASACNNLVNATLEGSFFDAKSLENLLKRNQKLAHINLTALSCVNDNSCLTLAQYCTQIEVLNVSWCKTATAKGIETVLESCPKLRDLRVGEIAGFNNVQIAETFFKVNRLERLVMNGCSDLSNAFLRVMMHGSDPKMDLLTDRPIVPPRRLRHLDLGRCKRVSDVGLGCLAYNVPELEGLVLGGNTILTGLSLKPILASTPKLAFLDLEDLHHLKNEFFIDHLAKSPCVNTLTHLSISYCEDVTDAAAMPLIRACTKLRSLEIDNTRISDLSLIEATNMVRARASRSPNRKVRPYIGLSLTVFDCPNITEIGIRDVASRNAEILRPDPTNPNLHTYPTEIIALKCFYQHQMTFDEHTKRVLRGDLAHAHRFERMWADRHQALEEAGVRGPGARRRRRRARALEHAHMDEEQGAAGGTNDTTGQGMGIGRRRARTATCAIM